MVGWVAPLVHIADTRVTSYGELCMCLVCAVPSQKGSAMNELFNKPNAGSLQVQRSPRRFQLQKRSLSIGVRVGTSTAGPGSLFLTTS